MRDPVRAVLAAVALTSVVAGVNALAADVAVGRRVVSDRSLCRVEKVNGHWLYLAAEGDGRKIARGWARADQVKSLDQAIVDYSARISARPEAALFYDRGRFWLAKGEYDIAIADLDEVIRADPRCARAYYYRGCAWTDKGDFANDAADLRRGLADFDAAVQLDPSSVTTYCERGSAWLKLGQIYTGQMNDGERGLERFEEWMKLSKAYDEAIQKAEAFDSPEGPLDATIQGQKAKEREEERTARLASYQDHRREFDKIIKFARIERGAALRNASADFDAAIRLDPEDPRAYARREELRSVLSADAGVSTSRR